MTTPPLPLMRSSRHIQYHLVESGLQAGNRGVSGGWGWVGGWVYRKKYPAMEHMFLPASSLAFYVFSFGPKHPKLECNALGPAVELVELAWRHVSSNGDLSCTNQRFHSILPYTWNNGRRLPFIILVKYHHSHHPHSSSLLNIIILIINNYHSRISSSSSYWGNRGQTRSSSSSIDFKATSAYQAVSWRRNHTSATTL